MISIELSFQDFKTKSGWTLSHFQRLGDASGWTREFPLSWLIGLAILESNGDGMAINGSAIGPFQGIHSQGWTNAIRSKNIMDHTAMVKDMVTSYKKKGLDNFFDMYLEHLLPVVRQRRDPEYRYVKPWTTSGGKVRWAGGQYMTVFPSTSSLGPVAFDTPSAVFAFDTLRLAAAIQRRLAPYSNVGFPTFDGSLVDAYPYDRIIYPVPLMTDVSDSIAPVEPDQFSPKTVKGGHVPQAAYEPALERISQGQGSRVVTLGPDAEEVVVISDESAALTPWKAMSSWLPLIDPSASLKRNANGNVLAVPPSRRRLFSTFDDQKGFLSAFNTSVAETSKMYNGVGSAHPAFDTALISSVLSAFFNKKGMYRHSLSELRSVAQELAAMYVNRVIQPHTASRLFASDFIYHLNQRTVDPSDQSPWDELKWVVNDWNLTAHAVSIWAGKPLNHSSMSKMIAQHLIGTYPDRARADRDSDTTFPFVLGHGLLPFPFSVFVTPSPAFAAPEAIPKITREWEGRVRAFLRNPILLHQVSGGLQRIHQASRRHVSYVEALKALESAGIRDLNLALDTFLKDAARPDSGRAANRVTLKVSLDAIRLGDVRQALDKIDII